MLDFLPEAWVRGDDPAHVLRLRASANRPQVVAKLGQLAGSVLGLQPGELRTTNTACPLSTPCN